MGIKDLVVDVVSKGFPRDKVEAGIEMLVRSGEAMEPKLGILQLI
jgi:hypothetical protein